MDILGSKNWAAAPKLDAGIDLVTAQVLMSHSSPVTTSIYDRREERVRRKAVQKLFILYTRRKLENLS